MKNRIWVLSLSIFVMVISVVALACAPGGPASNSTSPASGQANGYTSVTSEDLAQMLKSKDFYMVNVHTPYAGEIEGTDAKIAYDEVEKRIGEFPQDKKARIVVYCSSGSMSRTASQTLVRLGYTNVLDLTGGMAAWRKAGFTLKTMP